MTISPPAWQRRAKPLEAEESFVRDVERMLEAGGTRELDEESQAPEALPARPAAFVRYFLGFYTWPLVAMALLELGQAACQILIPKAVQQLIDSAAALAGTGGESAWTTLADPIRLFVLLNLGILVFSRSSGALLVMLGPSLRRRVRHSLYRYLQRHSQRYFLGNFAGSLANRIAEVSLGVNHSLWTGMFDFWPVTVTLVVTLVLLAQVHAWLALVLGLWTVGYVAVSYLLARRCREYAKAFAAARSTVTGKIVDAVANVMSSKLFARLEHERSYLGRYLDQEVKAARRTFWFMERMRWFQFVATLSLQVGMIVFAARLWLEGTISVGSFAMVASLLLMVINDVRNLSRRFLEFFEYIGNITDGVNVIIRPHEVTDVAGARPLAVTAGEIRFEHVDFAYPGGAQVFSGLTLDIRPGTRVGLVGFSGSGKSTLVNLILRLYDVQRGRILIDGQDIREVTQDSLRGAIAMISQEPILFHRSLIENVRYGRLEATDDEVQDAARRAHAHDFITSLPEGYDSLVGERGVRLSGGQRQRIAIARAVLKDAPIFFMDEATSSLDSVTERQIQDAIEELMRGRTAIVIAHRLSTIAHLDRIVVFHDGVVVEDGTHRELLARSGHYARLWSMQAGGFLPQYEDEAQAAAAAADGERVSH